MSVIDEVISFSRDYVNHPSARTQERKAKIRQALHRLTGQTLGISCGICYIEAIFKIINRTKMANYELRKGYVAQFSNPFRGIRAFTNLNLKTDPARYDPIAQEYLRLYPERAVFFIKIPKLAQPVKPVVKLQPDIKPELKFSTPNPGAVFSDVMETETVKPEKKKTKSRSRKSVKKSD